MLLWTTDEVECEVQCVGKLNFRYAVWTSKNVIHFQVLGLVQVWGVYNNIKATQVGGFGTDLFIPRLWRYLLRYMRLVDCRLRTQMSVSVVFDN